jgi:hypothetical protein
MPIVIPSITTPTAPTGKNASDYEKFVVVDTKGSLVEAGKVAYSLDLVKDANMQAKANFLAELFALVGMEFKVREARTQDTAKAVSPADLIKGLSAK